MTTKNYPKRNQVYTLKEIETELYLRDSAFLMVEIDGHENPIQTSHIGSADLLAADGWAETKWAYLYETEEWIPIFRQVGNDVLALIDHEPDQCYPEQIDRIWITPKAFPRAQ